LFRFALFFFPPTFIFIIFCLVYFSDEKPVYFAINLGLLYLNTILIYIERSWIYKRLFPKISED
jgi:hypothetical protein